MFCKCTRLFTLPAEWRRSGAERSGVGTEPRGEPQLRSGASSEATAQMTRRTSRFSPKKSGWLVLPSHFGLPYLGLPSLKGIQMPVPQKKNWIVVVQLQDEDARPKDKPEGCSYYRYSVERAPTTGQLHAQGFAHFDHAQSFKAVKALFPGAHLEPMKGSWKQNLAYTGKPETHVSGPYEFGTAPHQGHRTDLENAVDVVKTPGPMKRVAEQYPVVYVKYSRGLQNLDFVLNPSPSWRALEVTWLWGPTGSGKTRSVFDRYGLHPTDRLFSLTEPYNWWDGYDKHEAVLFDEFYGQIPLHTMLHYLDGYPLRLQVKGAFVWAHYTQVYITSNVDPHSLYMGVPSDVRDAFFRRITSINKIDC